MAGHLAAQQQARLDLVVGGEIAERRDRRCLKPPQLRVHARRGDGVAAQPACQAPLDAVHCGHQEMPRAHGDVGAAKVEEGLFHPGGVVGGGQCVEALQMIVQRRLQGVVEEVLHCEGLGEIAAGAFADARTVVEVDAARGHLHLVAVGGRHEGRGAVLAQAPDRQILFGQRQLRLQQTLIDRAEGAHRQRPEIHRPDALGAVVDEHRRQRGRELGVGERGHRLYRRARGAHLTVAGEQPAVVGGQRPSHVAGVDGGPQRLDVGPHRCRRLVVTGLSAALVFGEAGHETGQRMVGVASVAGVGKQVSGLGVSHEQQPEEDHHHLLVGGPQILGRRIRPHARSDRSRQCGDGLVIDTVAQPHSQIGGEAVGTLQYLLDDAVFVESRGREQQMQIAGLLVGQQRQVGFHEGLCAALAANAGVGPGGVEAYLAAAGEHHPVGAVHVGVGQSQRHRREMVEPPGGRVERLVVVAEDGRGAAVTVDFQQVDVVGVLLDAEAEALGEAPAPQSHHRPAGRLRLRPVGALRQPGTQLLGGQQAHVAQARVELHVTRRGERALHLLQHAYRCELVGLRQSAVSEPLDLGHVLIEQHRRVVARRTAQRQQRRGHATAGRRQRGRLLRCRCRRR